MFNLINIAYADDLGVLLGKINSNIVNPIVELMFIIAGVIFVYGVVEFLMNAEDEAKRDVGKRHILWGMVGLFIMLSVFGIMQILVGTLGVKGVDVRNGTVDLTR